MWVAGGHVAASPLTVTGAEGRRRCRSPGTSSGWSPVKYSGVLPPGYRLATGVATATTPADTLPELACDEPVAETDQAA